MKLRARLSIGMSVVTAVALLASFAIAVLGVDRDETITLDQALVLQARDIARKIVKEGGDQASSLEGPASVPESVRSTTRYGVLYDKSGRVVAATKSLADGVPSLVSLGVEAPVSEDGQSFDLTSPKGRLLRGVAIPVDDTGRVLLYAASRSTVDDDTHFLIRLLTPVFVGAMLFTLLAARWLGGLLARDVDAIATVARSVAEGDLEARVRPGVRGSAETAALAADLNYMIQRLGEVMLAQRTFVLHAAHELRSPLSTLRGELQLALRRPREAAEYRQAIAEGLADVEALCRLAEDLLTLARVAVSRADAPSAAIGDVVAESLRIAAAGAAEKGVHLAEVEKSAGARAEIVPGSRDEIARVVRNLVDNAIAHSPTGTAVTVEITASDGRVEVAVVDAGPGVAPNDVPHIFEPFFRGPKNVATIGAGLGLAIAREIARRHRGDVTLDAEHAGGARFVLELPVNESTAHAAAAT